MNIISQYKGLRREIYILFIGRIVTNMGGMVWPVLTLILNKKLGFNATTIAVITIVSGVIIMPAGLIGGKLADRYNKRNIIVLCDIVSVAFYYVCAFIPLSMATIVMMLTASAFQSLEYPAYNALIAEVSLTKDRERAYSLQYLGGNIGLIASPTIAGLLFENYLWLSFAISATAIGMSTFLIFTFIKDIHPIETDDSREAVYQESREGQSLAGVLLDNKPLLLYMLSMALYQAAYSQYGYLMPLDLGRLHANGAVIYGSVSSLNCIVVVIFTPVFTKLFARMVHTKKTLLGEGLLLSGYVVFLLMLGHIPFYYIAMVLFTFGEILTTITDGPYLTSRIPASHRGRINGFMSVAGNIFYGVLMLIVGVIYDNAGSTAAWLLVTGILGAAIVCCSVLVPLDRRRYTELYVK